MIAVPMFPDWLSDVPAWATWAMVAAVLLIWGALCFSIGFARREDFEWAKRRQARSDDLAERRIAEAMERVDRSQGRHHRAEISE